MFVLRVGLEGIIVSLDQHVCDLTRCMVLYHFHRRDVDEAMVHIEDIYLSTRVEAAVRHPPTYFLLNSIKQSLVLPLIYKYHTALLN